MIQTYPMRNTQRENHPHYRRFPPLPATALDLSRTAIPPYSASRSRLLRVSSSSASPTRLLSRSLSSVSRIRNLARAFSSTTGSRNGCGARDESNSITIGSDASAAIDPSRLEGPAFVSGSVGSEEGPADEKAGRRIWIWAGCALGL